MNGFPSPPENPYRFGQPLPNFSTWPQPPASWIDSIKQPQKLEDLGLFPKIIIII